MSKRSIFSLCCAIVLLGAFLFGITLFERKVAREEQILHASATAYVPTTTVPPTTEPTEATEPPAVMAPEFIITDKDGRTFGVLNFKGKPTILCFWTTSAEAELDLMQELYNTYGKTANFALIHQTNQNEAKEDALAFLKEKDYTFPVYFDTLGTAATAYQISTSPTTFFMTAGTELKARSQGPLDPAALPKTFAAIGLVATEQ